MSNVHIVARLVYMYVYVYTCTGQHYYNLPLPYFLPDVSGPKPGGGKGRRKARRGDKGRILLNSLEQEMLCWAQNGFLPAGPRGLVPTSGVCVCVCLCVCVCVCVCMHVHVYGLSDPHCHQVK